MATHVDFSDFRNYFNSEKFDGSRTTIISIGSEHKHNLINHFQEYSLVSTNNISEVGKAIATSISRIAAIVILDNQIPSFCRRKIREYASAERAEMIWFREASLISESYSDIADLIVSMPYRLSNGIEVYHHSAFETDYLYEEIFIQNQYMPPGIELQAGDTIIDVGANIGMFALYIHSKHPECRVHCFEPSKSSYKKLTSNISHINNISSYNQGLSNKEGKQLLRHYEHCTVMSSYYDNHRTNTAMLECAELSTEIIHEKLGNCSEESTTVITLSSFIKHQSIDVIHLLKIDTEGSEIDILQGIDDNDWGRINQIILEAHSNQDAIIICELLEKKHFKINSNLVVGLEDAEINCIVATRAD